MSALLCDPATSPFLLEPARDHHHHHPPPGVDGSGGGDAGHRDGDNTAGRIVVITSPRPLLAGLAYLGAHEDLGQRILVLVS